MKFGYCLNMTSTKPDGTGIENLHILKDLGFDYAELPLAEMLCLNEEGIIQIVERLKEYDIPCLACNNLFPASLRLTGPEADMGRIRSHAEKALSLAAKLGAQVVVFGSGYARNVPEGFPKERAFEQMVDILRMIDPIAQEKGVQLTLEAARRMDTNIFNSYSEAIDWHTQADVKGAGILIDLFHEVWEIPDQGSIHNMKRVPDHIHIACPRRDVAKERCVPRENDGFDYEPFFTALKGFGYDRLMSIEAYVDDFETEAAETLSFLKKLVRR